MRIEQVKCFARAGLLGNPSDGYNGKAVSFSIGNFFAQVRLTEFEGLEFSADSVDPIAFDSLEEFVKAPCPVQTDGANRLLMAALKRICDHCIFNRVGDPDTGDIRRRKLFRVEFSSNIPRQVGMAGSSAIVIAAMKSYLHWFDVFVSPELLASMALAAEHDLGISAGLQDRVIQSLQGLVYMDFEQSVMRREDGLEVGRYECLDPRLLKDMYVAYANSLPESTDILHGDLKQKYDSGDVRVISTIDEIASLAVAGKQALVDGDMRQLNQLIDKNFDLRQSICVLNPGHVRMIETARSCGASAKYCGSGGAIVGVVCGDDGFENLKQQMGLIDCEVFRPEIV